MADAPKTIDAGNYQLISDTTVSAMEQLTMKRESVQTVNQLSADLQFAQTTLRERERGMERIEAALRSMGFRDIGDARSRLAEYEKANGIIS